MQKSFSLEQITSTQGRCADAYLNNMNHGYQQFPLATIRSGMAVPLSVETGMHWHLQIE
jgi:hypothetical protein